jgi:BirA family biotin operon repressor/biotin-[acetyl-CoA-carboxylase] ligase
MIHLSLETCQSTQIHLKNEIEELLKKDNHLLISTTKQTEGIGRRENTWDQEQQSIAFSFNISPSNPLSITSLEISVLLCEYVKEKFQSQLFLKWPNDLLLESGHKVAGIICHVHDSNNIVVGIGMNIGSKPEIKNSEKNYKYPAGFLNNERLEKNHYHNLPLEIYKYILENRLSNEDVKTKWNSLCFHLGQTVSIQDDNSKSLGIFEGIGNDGEALIKVDDKLQKFYTGSLFLDGL